MTNLKSEELHVAYKKPLEGTNGLFLNWNKKYLSILIFDRC